jgi:hypothetical protein
MSAVRAELGLNTTRITCKSIMSMNLVNLAWRRKVMSVPESCSCGKGQYGFGSALYAYYTCGHAYEKPLNSKEKGRFLTIKYNPYKPV